MKLLTHDDILKLQMLLDRLKHPDIRIDPEETKKIIEAIQVILKSEFS